MLKINNKLCVNRYDKEQDRTRTGTIKIKKVNDQNRNEKGNDLEWELSRNITVRYLNGTGISLKRKNYTILVRLSPLFI